MAYEKIIYKDVRRIAFEEMAKLCDNDSKYFGPVTVYYNGTGLRGDVTIDVAPGNSNVYNEIIVKFAEIVAKNN